VRVNRVYNQYACLLSPSVLGECNTSCVNVKTRSFVDLSNKAPVYLLMTYISGYTTRCAYESQRYL
jgi:hypothetical protein